MKGILAICYGTVCYLTAFASILYAVGFVGTKLVPKHLDSGRAPTLERALIIDVTLLSLFALQHSVMARPSFKARWTRIVPHPVERRSRKSRVHGMQSRHGDSCVVDRFFARP